MIRTLIDRMYRSKRGLDTGLDPSTADVDVLRFVSRKAVERFRGSATGAGATSRAREVKLLHRQHLTLGTDVRLGRGVEINALSKNGIHLGDRVTVDDRAIIRASGVIRNLGIGINIGPRTSVGAFNVILGQGGVTIGSDCLLGPHVTIVSENHVFADPTVPIREQGEIRSPIMIGDDVWIGAGATVLAGTSIGQGAVIASGAVVTGDVPSGAIYGGVPARKIGVRGS